MTHNTTHRPHPPPIPTPTIIIQQLKFHKFVSLLKFKDENKEDKVELFGGFITQNKQVILF